MGILVPSPVRAKKPRISQLCRYRLQSGTWKVKYLFWIASGTHPSFGRRNLSKDAALLSWMATIGRSSSAARFSKKYVSQDFAKQQLLLEFVTVSRSSCRHDEVDGKFTAIIYGTSRRSVANGPGARFVPPPGSSV